MAQVTARLTLAAFDPYAELAGFASGRKSEGGVASFVGLVRGVDGGAPVEALMLDHYPGFTEASLERIVRDVADRFEVGAVLVIHRAGRISPGEPIVLAAAAATHRRAAFDAVDYLMDRLKVDAAFWKRQDRVSTSVWIEPTAADRAARARWD